MKAKLIVSSGQEYVYFECPGCNGLHQICVPQWGWNRSEESPTFTPSVLVTFGHYVDGTPEADCPICIRIRERDKDQTPCGRCHSFVTDGKIQYLSDCSHQYAGQTIELPESDFKTL